MPKAPSSTPTAHKTISNPTPPRNSRTRAPRLPSAAPAETSAMGESTWRPSRIPPDQKIKKTDAKRQYRLGKNDLKDLQCFPVPTRFMNDKGHWVDNTMFLYLEREVERVAWRKHGGPNGFEAYLNRLRKTHQKRFPGKPFAEPLAYVPGWPAHNGPSVTPLTPDLMAILPVNNANNSFQRGLRGLQTRLTEKAQGNGWLWTACRAQVDALRPLTNQDYLARLHDACESLRTYPPRIPIPQSDSFRALNEVLAEADDPDNIGEDEDPFEGIVSHFWKNEFLERVSQALIDIVNAHGLGPEGWQAARWRVYDTWSSSVQGGGIDILRPGGPRDYAWFWLSGRLPESEFQFLPFDNKFDPDSETKWRQYNAMLPPGGSLG